MAKGRSLTPANWVRHRVQWELKAPTFRVPYGDDPTMLPAVAAQQSIAKRVLDHIRDLHAVGTYRLAEVPLGPDGIQPVVNPLPYSGFSKTISNALAGTRLLTFDVYCDLVAVFGPEVVPGPAQLTQTMAAGIGSVKAWPEPGSWKSRQTRPVMNLASARATLQRIGRTDAPVEPEVPHPDADMAVAGLVIQLAPEIDAWAGEGTADALEVEVDVYVGGGRANLVVSGGLLSGEMWLPEDWGVRVAEECRSPAGAFVLDDLGLDDVAGEQVPTYSWALPLHRFDQRSSVNPVYLAIGDVVVRRYSEDGESWTLHPH